MGDHSLKLLSIEEEAQACREAFRNSEIGNLAWHLHHQQLAEQLDEPAESRIDYIISDKPKREQALRLRLFRPARSAAVAPARKAYDAATASAQKAYDAAIAPAHSKECPSCPWRNGTIFPESE